MKIIIDCGHYYFTPGKRVPAELDPEETREWTLNQLVGRHLQSLLSSHMLEVIRADDTTGKREVTLKQRVALATSKDDLYISIHHNAGSNLTKAGGIVVYRYYEKGKNQLIYEAEAALQQGVYAQLIKETGLSGNRSTPTPYGNLYVLREAKCPAILCELGFMDSLSDWPVISNPDYAYKCATAIYNGVIDWLKLYGLMPEEVRPVTDNIASPWALEAVTWACDSGLLAGDDTGNLHLHKNVTREQLMVILKAYHDKVAAHG